MKMGYEPPLPPPTQQNDILSPCSSWKTTFRGIFHIFMVEGFEKEHISQKAFSGQHSEVK